MIFDVSSMTKQQQLTLWGEDSPNVSTAHFVMRMSIVSCEVTLSTTVVMGDSVRSFFMLYSWPRMRLIPRQRCRANRVWMLSKAC